jgi:hypothetical protein
MNIAAGARVCQVAYICGYLSVTNKLLGGQVRGMHQRRSSAKPRSRETRIASVVVTSRWELGFSFANWLACDLGVREKGYRRGPEQSEGRGANECNSVARGERARTPRGGDTPALNPILRGTQGRRVCRTAYLAHLRPAWFRHGCVWRGAREAGARKLRPVGAKVRSGRRGKP